MEIYAIHIQKRIEDKLFHDLLGYVNPAKQDRVKKYRFWQDAHNSLFAELLIRKVASEKLNITNENLIFSTGEFGKPFIVNSYEFEFNISHSKEWVLVGIDNKPIGVDVEKIAPVEMNIAKNYFSQQEYIDLMAYHDKIDYFFTLWSLKESFIKYTGKGLSYPLHSFSMVLSGEKIKVKVGEKIAHEIYLKLYQVDSEYKMAVCSANSCFPEEIKWINIDEQIEVWLANSLKKI